MNDEFGSFSYGDETEERKEEPKQKRWTPEPYKEKVYQAPNYVRTDYSRQDYLKNSGVQNRQNTATPGTAGSHIGPAILNPGSSAPQVQSPAMGSTPQVQPPVMNSTPQVQPPAMNSTPQVQRTPVSRPVPSVTPNTPHTPVMSGVPGGPDVPKQKDKKEKGDSFGRKLLRTAALGLVFGLVGGAAFLGLNSGKFFGSSDKDASTTGSSETSTGTPDTSVSAGSGNGSVKQQGVVSTDNSSTTVNYDVAEIVKKAQPSIVSITTSVTTQYQYFYQQFEQQSTGAGSGIIIANDEANTKLYIATNYHVIEGATEINVGFNDGQIIKASVTGYDKNNDVAVVEIPLSDIPQSTRDAISIAALGNSDALQVGEPAIAIGNALGYGQSVTVGYISALNRSITGSDGHYIQTDAAINPGNSGGALINSKGEVIGINSVKYVDSKVEGMGFSIPINRATDIINNIVSGGTTGKVYIGISGANINSEYSQIYGFPEGAYVKTVTSGSPAEKAGIHEGDIIVAIEGTKTMTMEDLIDALQSYRAGTTVKITLYRANSRGKYEEMTIDVVTAEE